MRFSAGKALSDSFAILGARFAPMAAIAAVFYLVPMGIFLFYIQQLVEQIEAQPEPDFAAIWASIAGIAGIMVLGYLAYTVLRTLGACALCVAAGEQRPPSVSEAISEGARALLPMIAVYLLLLVAWIAMFGVLFLSVGAAMFGAFSGQTPPGGGAIAGFFLGFFVLLVAVIYIAARLSMVLPVVTLGKQRNPIEAIAGSWRMTKGATLKIILLFLLFAFAAGIVNGVASAVTGGLSMAAMPLTGPAFWTQIAVAAVMDALFGIYTVALLIAIHSQLAGPSTEAVSETFA